MKEAESLILLTPKRAKRLDGTYYHITTERYLPGRIELYPRVPRSSANGELDLPRICMAPSVSQCLISICHNHLYNMFAIYKADVEVYLPIGVPDARVTEEIWCLSNHGVVFERCNTITNNGINTDVWVEFKKILRDTYVKSWTWMGVDLTKLSRYHLLIKEQLKLLEIEDKP